MFIYSRLIQEEDLNFIGHVGTDRVLYLFREAWRLFLDKLGYTETDIGGGVGMIQKAFYMESDKEILAGEIISVNIDGFEGERTAFTLYYSITTESGPAFTGYMKLQAFDCKARKFRRVPVSFLRRVRGALYPLSTSGAPMFTDFA
ncbi:MAG: hypothetical protein LBQ97_06880 [Fusobacteriaceae bacterium]|jgi:acyl-CoA thioesterase FadM|nr:hypothetical protein [Fusobacteriaceae bacterium]